MRNRVFALAALLGFILPGCAPAAPVESDKISVVATIFAPFDFARQITGDLADVTMLLPPGSEAHSFEPTAQDILKIQNSDVFIHIGGKSDEWVRDILSSMDPGPGIVVTLMDWIELLEEDDGHHGHHHEDKPYDEHIWTSPLNAMRMAMTISTWLQIADPDNAGLYEQNAEGYLQKLAGLDSAFLEVMDSAQRSTVIFGDRFPFLYLAEAYGLQYYAAFPGCTTATEPSMQTIAFLIEKVQNEQIPVVFHAELSSTRVAETIAEATGAKVLLLHSCHNITKEDFDNGAHYYELMTGNVAALKEALG